MTGTTLDTMHQVEVGDYVASTVLSHFTGFVMGEGTLGTRYPAWEVELWNGKTEYFPKADTRVVHKSDSWWEQHAAEVAAGTIVYEFPETESRQERR